MIFMDVDIALSEVPINVVPLTDDTDFKTREESVTYDQSGLDLVWNFVTTGGAFTQTTVTPTDTAGDYDFVNQGNGDYTIEIPASGGASINNDTEGYGWFSGFATGILPWRGPTIGFRAAGLNNKLIDDAYSATRGLAGTALPDAAADAIAGLPISDAGGLDLDALNTAAVRLTAARAQAIDDWINDGRLDAIMDLIAADVVNIDGAAMRGTNSALTASTFSTMFSGITALAQWLGLIAGKQAGNATALTEMKATGAGSGTYDPTTDSTEALRDRGDSAWPTATGFSTHTAANVRTEMDSNSTQFAAIVADTGTDGVVLSTATQQSIADEVLKRAVSNVEATADKHSLGAVIMISTNSSLSGTTLTAKKPSDDSTFKTYTVTVDSAADPITGVS